MHASNFINITFFFGLFLALTAFLQVFSLNFHIPYTVLLLIVGLIAQFTVHFFEIGFHFNLSTNVIFFVLLPLLLFESALHINFHQFRLQFKTITFLATFGLLISIFATGIGLSLLIGLPFGVALLFGALISATDPIAVLALFKNLGAPKRLALLTEGESMFNDATAVILFRLISGFVVAQQTLKTQTIFTGVLEFLYVFIGSIILGTILGYLTSLAISKIINNRIVETTLTAALAIGSFVFAEHFLQLSGVITTVIAGIYIGNFGKTKISGGVIHFIEEMWEYGGFFAVSLIFFFTAFNLNVNLLTQRLTDIFWLIIVILIARSIAVYLSFYLSNHLKFFKNEPNVPISWQHTINWGGLRGIIPLVLVYSLPDEFPYKNDFLAYTLAAFMFTLFINATTIKKLLTWLKLNLKPKTDKIINEEILIFKIEEAEKKLKQLSVNEFDQDVIEIIDSELTKQELRHQKILLKLASAKELLLSLQLQAINIELQTIEKLFQKNHINENVYFDFEVELDLQRDALEFHEVYHGRGYSRGGFIQSKQSFRQQLKNFRRYLRKYPFLRKIFKISRRHLIEERMSLLKARIVASEAVIEYLNKVNRTLKTHTKAKLAIDHVKKDHQKYIKDNQEQLIQLENQFPHIAKDYQKKIIYNLVIN